MGMRVDDDPNVLGAKTEGANVLVDDWSRLRQGSIEQDQALIVGDEEC